MTAAATPPTTSPLPDELITGIAALVEADPDGATFLERVATHGPVLEELLTDLYGSADALEALLRTAAAAWLRRPADLRRLDDLRLAEPMWFQSNEMVAAMAYADRFAGSLAGVSDRLDHLESLGVNYLHLMPPWLTPPGGGDGGYAVSSYRMVDPALGTLDDLRTLAADLRSRGISLALDLVVNHTADDHAWAQAAKAGDEVYRDFYFHFEDRDLVDRYQEQLREIFPESRPGNFTEVEGLGWVWTTFYSFQWDLDYSNPAVLDAMGAELLHLANVGAEVVRMDAVPFIWKELGTSCENLPQTHTILRIFYQLTRLAAPATILKSEAIVHPDDVVSYLGEDEWAGRECQIAYHPLLMVELWEAMATGWTHLLRRSMEHRFTPPEGTAWLNYVRSHDDIGWGFADEDAEALGIHAFWHRQFLNRFYTGTEEGSWAAGLPFQYHPETGDMRVSGTTAALVGLQRALDQDDAEAIDLAIARLSAILGIVMSIGGIPLIYLGDEIGMTNADYVGHDSRWSHRPVYDWDRAALANEDPASVPGRLLATYRRLSRLRRATPDFGAGVSVDILDLGNHVFGFRKGTVTVAANFTPNPQAVDLPAGLDLISAEPFDSDHLDPYRCVWLAG